MVSLPGLIGAVVGGLVGTLDFGLVVAMVRRAQDRAGTTAASPLDAGWRERLLRVAFAVNLAVFAGLGYWFGVAMTG